MTELASLDPSYLEDTIGYHFHDKKYLLTALTHSSYANEGKHLQSNERLEFLGINRLYCADKECGYSVNLDENGEQLP